MPSVCFGSNVDSEELDEAARGAAPFPANQDRQLNAPASAPNDNDRRNDDVSVGEVERIGI